MKIFSFEIRMLRVRAAFHAPRPIKTRCASRDQKPKFLIAFYDEKGRAKTSVL